MNSYDKPVIRVKVRDRDIDLLPEQAHPSEWYDLTTSEEVELKAGEFRYIDLGVCIEVPEGYEAHLAPRSSTFKKWGILQTNSVGVIDHAYCGDSDWWKLPSYATRDVTIPAYTKIAQFRIVPVQEDAIIELVSHLGNKDRGGLGSTDKMN